MAAGALSNKPATCLTHHVAPGAVQLQREVFRDRWGPPVPALGRPGALKGEAGLVQAARTGETLCAGKTDKKAPFSFFFCKKLPCR